MILILLIVGSVFIVFVAAFVSLQDKRGARKKIYSCAELSRAKNHPVAGYGIKVEPPASKRSESNMYESPKNNYKGSAIGFFLQVGAIAVYTQFSHDIGMFLMWLAWLASVINLP